VWETHGLGHGHAVDGAALGPPYDARTVPGVPAVVVKPRSVADAYALRGQFRQGGTIALFPAEVLVSVYRSVGDVRDVVVVASALNNVLLFLSVLLLAVMLVSLRRRRYALLRALGASRVYVLLVTWLGAAVLMAAGCLAGLALGWAGAFGVSAWLGARTGLHLATVPGLEEVWLVAIMAAMASVLAAIPALAAWHSPVSQGLRGG
jgi:putative ABC transport system permease protein